MATVQYPINWSLVSRLSRDLDFYYERGLLIARTYPRTIKQPGTSGQTAMWLNFIDGQSLWTFLLPVDRAAWKTFTFASEYRGRDYFLSRYLSHVSRAPGPWVAYQQQAGGIIAGALDVTCRVQPASVPLLRYQVDEFPVSIKPWYWKGFGHRIRNRTLYRRWRLIQNWPSTRVPDFVLPGNQFRWILPLPPAAVRIWYQYAVDQPASPPGQAGVSGIYSFVLA